MSNALAIRDEINLDDLQRTARMLVASGYFDAKGTPEVQIAQLATKIMAGRELGYGPFASVQGIHVIQGKPQVSANLMAAAVKSHPRYDYRVRKMDADGVKIEFFENGESIGVSEFTREDAAKAGTQNINKFPRNMLFARALSNGVRWFCPDVFHGQSVYVEGELEDTGNDTPAVVVVDKATGEVIEGEYTPVTPVTPVTPTNGNGNGNGHKPLKTQEDVEYQVARNVVDGKPLTAPVEDGAAGWAANPDAVLFDTAYQFANLADALSWGVAMNVFNHYNHAKNAYEELKREHKPQTPAAMYGLWINDVARRVNEAKAEPVAA